MRNHSKKQETKAHDPKGQPAHSPCVKRSGTQGRQPKKISPRNGKSVYGIAAVAIFDVLNLLTEEQKQTPKTCNYLLQTTPPERMSLQ
ncbi:MAG: hypothetical protein SPL14_00365 [Candidatus Onthomorpha sp.]|nr:hypothetical protein [Bacteroidales bacterium]MDD7484898.1 hypothetical protein [Bacteroidales bacterium]MDY5697868.1 hypothetical protein [Candidatus Onthomorpha sp.]